MPAALFFLYLAIALVLNPSAALKTDITQEAATTARLFAAEGAGGGTTNTGEDFFTNIGKMMAVIGILVGGLMAANSLGIEGAGAAMALAGKTKGWIGGATGRIAKGAAKGVLSPVTNRMLVKGGLIDKASTAAAKLATVPGFRGIGTAAAAGLSKLTASRQQAVENYQKTNLSNLNNDALKSITAKPSWDPVANAAMASELAKRNMTDPNNIDPARLTAMLTHAKSMGVGKQILENRADLAPQLIDKKPDQTDLDVIRATISKLSPQAIIKQSAEALKNDAVIRSLKDNQLAEIYKSGSGEQMEALKFGIEKLKDKEPDHPVVQFSMNNPKAQGFSGKPKIIVEGGFVPSKPKEKIWPPPKA